MDNFELPEIWLSSTEHLQRFNEIAHRLKWWKQIFWKQKFDNTFPQIAINQHRIPIVFFSSGILRIENNSIVFKARKPKDILNSKYLNIDNYMEFTLNINEIKVVERYKIPNARYEKHNYPWVKIDMQDGKEYLVLSNIRRGQIERGLEETQRLFDRLKNNNE